MFNPLMSMIRYRASMKALEQINLIVKEFGEDCDYQFLIQRDLIELEITMYYKQIIDITLFLHFSLIGILLGIFL